MLFNKKSLFVLLLILLFIFVGCNDKNEDKKVEEEKTEITNNETRQEEVDEKYWNVDYYINDELYKHELVLEGTNLELFIPSEVEGFLGWKEEGADESISEIIVMKDIKLFSIIETKEPTEKTETGPLVIMSKHYYCQENDLFFQFYPICKGSEFDLHFTEPLDDGVKAFYGQFVRVTYDEEGNHCIVKNLGNPLDEYPESQKIIMDENYHAVVRDCGKETFMVLFVNMDTWSNNHTLSQRIDIYDVNDYSYEPVPETSKLKEEFKCEYDYFTDKYYYFFNDGEKISTSYIQFNDGELQRWTYQESDYGYTEISKREYKVVQNKNHVKFEIDEDGVIHCPSGTVSGIVIQIITTVHGYYDFDGYIQENYNEYICYIGSSDAAYMK